MENPTWIDFLSYKNKKIDEILEFAKSLGVPEHLLCIALEYRKNVKLIEESIKIGVKESFINQTYKFHYGKDEGMLNMPGGS